MVHAILKRLLILLALPTIVWGSGIYNPGSTGGGGAGSGTVNPGTQNQIATYAASGSSATVSGSSVIKVFASSAALTGTLDMGSNQIVLVDTTATTSPATVNQLEGLAAANGSVNANFISWRSGTSFSNPTSGNSTADLWKMYSNQALGGVWSVAREATTTHNALYSAKVGIATFQSNTVYGLEQVLSNYYDYLGSSVTLTAWVNSGQAATIGIKDNVGITTSTAHPADSAWHQLSVTRFIASNATSVSILLGNYIAGANRTDYYDNVMFVPGNLAVNYVPRPYSIEMSAVQTESSSTVGGIIGIPTNTNAVAGDVGEYVSSKTVGTPALPASSAYGDLVSINLTPGDWDITFNYIFFPQSSVLGVGSQAICGISTTAGNDATGLVQGDNQSDIDVHSVTGVNSAMSINVPVYRVSISANTTYYGKVSCTSYTGGPPLNAGRLTARRVR